MLCLTDEDGKVGILKKPVKAADWLKKKGGDDLGDLDSDDSVS